jgi:DNA-binding NtrC family response regulator
LNDFHSNGELSNSISSNNSNASTAIQPTYLAQPSSSNSQPMIISEENIHHHEEIEESLNIMDKEKELIVKALKKHKGKRRDASLDLGISERTLYRKLKEYDIDE